ncbi:zf-HC2 domain-containing protein [Paenibacillus brevis]|uniref:Zf-HC2 domain-containing protein n=1 Tax=Paenibacillus brevis TaxID=2841508 RepID=A0ABS6FP56_9BACL|nr:zf-HC2 domain-containing protein [Paenibacillus brevis]MBU5671764.1 zf-HC2 domain-containing protein [Paenibacillus brevis]
MDCKQASSLMHDFLDDDLPHEQALELKQHLQACPSCDALYRELEQTEMLMFATIKHTAIKADDELVDRIMHQIPRQYDRQPFPKWVRRHPALTAAALFLVVMLFSAVSMWDKGEDLVVKTAESNQSQLIIEGKTVTVPEGVSIAGNLTIENGDVQILGEVQGNLTVIDGSYYQASTAHIAGEIKSIDQALDWIWYRISNVFTEVAYR